MNTEKKPEILPELLAPAGSPEALEAAIAAGADAVYFGGSAFNARMNAKNFAGASLAEAFRRCRDSGVRTNVTLNTLVHTRELYDLLKAAEELYVLGADALIVADLGAASLIHSYFPDLELHASTQAAGHNLAAARELAKLGFTRMVAARELSREDLALLCRESPIETEMFVHGAICVSQSGGCLASSIIGGRSGNRGECAQPCRLPYRSDSGRESYALSLKDMCLAEHIPELTRLGVASLKIEGRMKSADYVYGVTSVYRRLLDENRSAEPCELEKLRSLFSRSGFTDGYFTGRLGARMLGIRTEADKSATKRINEPPISYKRLADERAERFAEAKRLPLDMLFELRSGQPARLTVSCGGSSAEAVGQIPVAAINQPLTVESVTARLAKLGATRFTAGKIDVRLDEGLLLPMSAINALRRDAVARLPLPEARLREKNPRIERDRLDAPAPNSPTPRSVRFASPERIPAGLEGFDLVYLPLERFVPNKGANAVIIPPVIRDSETEKVRELLGKACDAGVRDALVSNVGHIALARELGMTAHGDFRLNVYNPRTIEALTRLGLADVIASPELTLAQTSELRLAAVVYGRLPMMTLEKCVIRDLYGCEACEKREFLPLIDRKDAKFPMTRAFEHRNVMYNSVPIYMGDRPAERARLAGEHFIFTDESASEAAQILAAYRANTPASGSIRRMK